MLQSTPPNRSRRSSRSSLLNTEEAEETGTESSVDPRPPLPTIPPSLTLSSAAYQLQQWQGQQRHSNSLPSSPQIGTSSASASRTVLLHRPPQPYQQKQQQQSFGEVMENMYAVDNHNSTFKQQQEKEERALLAWTEERQQTLRIQNEAMRNLNSRHSLKLMGMKLSHNHTLEFESDLVLFSQQHLEEKLAMEEWEEEEKLMRQRHSAQLRVLENKHSHALTTLRRLHKNNFESLNGQAPIPPLALTTEKPAPCTIASTSASLKLLSVRKSPAFAGNRVAPNQTGRNIKSLRIEPTGLTGKFVERLHAATRGEQVTSIASAPDHRIIAIDTATDRRPHPDSPTSPIAQISSPVLNLIRDMQIFPIHPTPTPTKDHPANSKRVQTKEAKVVGEYFMLKGCIGEGRYGKVYKCFHTVTKQAYAMKEISKWQNEVKVVNEVALMKNLKHKNIVHLVDFLETDREYYIVMELCQEVLLKQDRVSGVANRVFDERHCLVIFEQLFLGIEYIHGQGAVHRDIKPANLLIVRGGSHDILKIGDFGISQVFAQGQEMAVKDRCGTRAYLAPELDHCDGRLYDAPLTDVWSMGVTLHVMFHGELPFRMTANGRIDFEKRRHTIKELPENLRDLIERMLELNPDRRITMEEIRVHPWMTTNRSSPIVSKSSNIGAKLEVTNEDKMLTKVDKTDKATLILATTVAEDDSAYELSNSGVLIQGEPLYSPMSDSWLSTHSNNESWTSDDYLEIDNEGHEDGCNWNDGPQPDDQGPGDGGPALKQSIKSVWANIRNQTFLRF